MTFEQLATVLSPFVACFAASAWLHSQLSGLRETIAGLKERILYLERELDRFRKESKS